MWDSRGKRNDFTQDKGIDQQAVRQVELLGVENGRLKVHEIPVELKSSQICHESSAVTHELKNSRNNLTYHYGPFYCHMICDQQDDRLAN